MFGLARITVIGASMAPTLLHGERWLVTPGRVRAGRLVLLREPDRPALHTVKRVIRIVSEGIWVEGDNVDVSRDSRHFGVVPRENVLGVLRWKLRAVPAAEG